MNRVYQCDFCPTVLPTRGACRQHEQECLANPAVHGCPTCRSHSVERERHTRPPIHRCARESIHRRCPKWEENARSQALRGKDG